MISAAGVVTAAVAATAVKATASSTAVKTSASATRMAAAVLRERGGRQGKADERQGCECGEKRFGQGGFAHCSLHLNGGFIVPRQGKPLWILILPPFGTQIQERSCAPFR
jgi:hypothetical protein